MGKGDRYRPVDKKRYDVNYDKIFGNRAGRGTPTKATPTHRNESKRRKRVPTR